MDPSQYNPIFLMLLCVILSISFFLGAIWFFDRGQKVSRMMEIERPEGEDDNEEKEETQCTHCGEIHPITEACPITEEEEDDGTINQQT